MKEENLAILQTNIIFKEPISGMSDNLVNAKEWVKGKGKEIMTFKLSRIGC